MKAYVIVSRFPLIVRLLIPDFSKQLFSSLLTVPGITIDLSPLHPLNALIRITVTLSGMSMDVSFLLSEKASWPMVVTVDGITVDADPYKRVLDEVSMIALQFWRLS